MMATVPRIAAVSCLGTLPFVYGLKHAGSLRAELLLSAPSDCIADFAEGRADLALLPAGAVPSLAGAKIVTEYCVGGIPSAREALLECGDPLLDAWKPFGELPCAFAVWVARPDTDPGLIEELGRALTFGLEHTYEAILASGYADRAGQAYEYLSRFDYIYDNQKHKALRKFWDSGLKTAPRTNPG